MNNKGAGGFTIFETLVATLAGSILLLACLAGFQTIQDNLLSFHTTSRQENQILTAVSLLAHWIAHAGSGVSGQTAVSINDSGLSVAADIDGPDGMPDGTLQQSYESISIRSNGIDLQIKANQGSFQPTLKNVSKLEARLEVPSLLEMDIESRLAESYPDRFQVPATERTCQFFLPNLRPSLFEK